MEKLSHDLGPDPKGFQLEKTKKLFQLNTEADVNTSNKTVDIYLFKDYNVIKIVNISLRRK